jgi:ribosomal RNA-processing protein 17
MLGTRRSCMEVSRVSGYYEEERLMMEVVDAGANDDDSDDESGSDEEESPRKAIVEAEYETSGLITTVLVESFNLSRSPTPERHPSRSPPPGGYEVDEDGKGMKSTRVSGSVSSKKRVKNKPQFRPKMSRADKKERATGGKSKKAGFLKGNVGTKGKANKGKP